MIGKDHLAIPPFAAAHSPPGRRWFHFVSAEHDISKLEMYKKNQLVDL